MEQFTNITEHKPPTRPATATQARSKPFHSPLYGSPWVALFILLRREFRQPRTLEN